MRRMMIAGLLALAATAAVAQPQAPVAAPQAIACAGNVMTYRYSAIKPGQEALFRKAAADHAAWYASKGSKTSVQLLRVLVRSGSTVSYDDTHMISLVTYDGAPQPPRDAGWDQFVKEYADSSDVVEEHRGCLPG